MLKRSQYFAPGKLFIAGEYAVTQPGGKALLCPVKLGITTQLHIRKKFAIRNEQYPEHNQKFTQLSEIKDLRLRLSLEIAKEIALYYGKAWVPFSIHIQSTLEKDGKKYGMGGSGAVVVSLLGAILKLFLIPFTHIDLYKLAVKVLWNIEPHASFADAAVSAYNQPIFYQKFSHRVIDFLNFDHSVQLLQTSWPGLIIQPIKLSHHIQVIYTGLPAQSANFVKDIVSMIDDSFIKHSNELVERYLNQYDLNALHALQNLIKQLGLKADHQLIDDEAERLIKQLSSQQIAVKYSGAGKGDCLIVVSQEPVQINPILEQHFSSYELLEDIIRL